MTAQISEKLIFQGETLNMCTEPLRFWLSTSGKNIELHANSTACWRGYVGSWKIINERLYLVDFQGSGKDGSEVLLEDLFPGYRNIVFAHWFTGEVRCPYGKMLKYIHMGYSSTYEKDIYMKFSKGILISKKIITNGVGEEGAGGYGVAAFTKFPSAKVGSA